MARALPASLVLLAALATIGCPQTVKKGGGNPSPTPTPSGITINGGTVTDLRFAIVGDTRPQTVDDTASYPNVIITKIFQDLEAANPRPDFSVSTGDYIFASNSGGQAGPQLDKYLDARSKFSNPVFPAMGNHECTGYTNSNCGTGTAQGLTAQYQAYMSKFLAPIGADKPYFSFRVDDVAGAWTSKFVFVAPNAWTQAQATWLDAALSDPTTYTFVIRHEDVGATTAPGTVPSADIIGAHPYTLLIVGHSHTYLHSAANKELIVGNGGAPITTSANYGYVIAHRRADGAIEFNSYAYDTNAVNDTFALNPDGTAAP